MKRSIAAFVVLTAAGAGAAAPVEIKLPPEKVALVASPLPGYALAQAMCLTCHSADYMAYQPSTSPRAFWQGAMTKMQKTFAAPIPDDAVAPLVDYFVKTYGAERVSPEKRVEPVKAPPAPLSTK